MSISLAVKEGALAVGFDLAGIAPLGISRDLEFAERWVKEGYGGEMRYLANPKRADPHLVLPSAKSVVCVGLVYNAPFPYSTEVVYQSRSRPSSFVPGPLTATDSIESSADDQRRGTNDQGQATAGESPRAWISRYAWGHDYHTVMRRKLEALRADLEALAPGVETRVYVDTGPIVERAFARLSGIGWMGKNTCLINQQKGSWFFLGVILTSLELEPDLPSADRCGSCTRCLEACPTGALAEPYVMNASKCIAYFNIELKGPIPVEHRPAIGMNVIGCDICQDVCPWNGGGHQLSAVSNQPAAAGSEQEAARSRRRQVATTQRPEFHPMMLPKDSLPLAAGDRKLATDNRKPASTFSLFHPPLEALSSLSAEDFSHAFANSPIKRVKYRGWLRNLCVVMGNSGDRRFVPWLERLCEGDDPVVREHAEWALEMLKIRPDPEQPTPSFRSSPSVSTGL